MGHFRYLCCFALALLLLGGCKTTGGSFAGASDASNVAIDDSSYQPEADLTTRQRLRMAIDLLEAGRKVAAQAELNVYLAEKPDSQLAADLLRQINADPKEYFGKKHFLYTMKTGDSLSIVARRFLGDALKFYMLARYNGIDNPSRISVGQEIRVPGSPPAPVVAAAAITPAPTAPAIEETADTQAAPEPAPAAPPEPVVETVTQAAPEPEVSPGFMSAAAATLPASEPESELAYTRGAELAKLGDYGLAIDQLENGLKLSPGDRDMSELLVTVYADYALELNSEGRTIEARNMLQRAAALDPNNAELVRRLGETDKTIAVETQYKIAVEYTDAGAPDQAYDAFSQVLKLRPGHTQAQSQKAKLVPAVTNLYHRRAVLAFRRQELDEALRLWGKLLQIDPNHTNAKIYQAQTLELKERLENLDSAE